ncbi:hypothetical protein, partial [Bacillus sp. WP8]|uniref:hypothetical protein n=1 Tax=Bacillus sp. WP8 TaxID=756828 RepID=UPI001642E6AB
DGKDQEKGDYRKGSVGGEVGEVKDRDWESVRFEGRVGKGEGGKDIKNSGNVKGEKRRGGNGRRDIEMYRGDGKVE